jgi:hypothetical protein
LKIEFLAVFVSLPAASLFAREFRGRFSGAVTDSQGAAIARAKVVATETSTGSQSDAVSETTGVYSG